MIQSAKINGIDIVYAISKPGVDEAFVAYDEGATVKEIGQASGADAAIDFNFANNDIGEPIGRVIVDGVEVVHDGPKTKARDEIYMLPDGSWHIGKAPANAVHATQGSPRILKDGKSFTAESIERDQLADSTWQGENYRTAGGVTADGRLVAVRTLDKVDMDTLEEIMLAMGCPNALNGDGGGSACLWPHDNGWGRKMGVALCFKKGDEPMTNPFKLIGNENPELVIAPGHGGSDPGATGNGIIEKLLTLDAGLYLFKRFGELGVPRAITRDTDIYIGPDELAAMVESSGAKHCISPHINGGGGEGAEVIHSIHNDGKLANLIAAELKKAGQNVRRVFCRASEDNPKLDYYFMHRETGDVITNIVEFFFLDSKATGPDADLNEYKTEWKDWLEAVVKAYFTYTGRKYTPPAAPEPAKEKKSIFSDVPAEHWADGVIAEAEAYGLMGGYPDGTFKPDQQPTRAEMAAAMVKLFKKLGGV